MKDSNHRDEKTPLTLSRRFEDKDNTTSTGIRPAGIQLKGQGHPCDVGNIDEKSWRSRLRNAEYRTKVFRSLGDCLSGFTVGLVIAQAGPALLDLQIITQTSVQEASTFLIAATVGSMLGSSLCGVIYDHLSKDLLLILSELFMGLCLLAIPFCSDYWLMVIVFFLLHAFRMSAYLTANVELFRMWGTQATTLTLAFQFCLAVGGILAPLITEPFLVSPNNTAVIDHSNRSTNDTLDLLHLDADCDLDRDAIPGASKPEAQNTRVHFAFIITSTMCFFTTAILVAEYVNGKAKGTNNSKSKLSEDGHATFEGERRSQEVETPPRPSCDALSLPRVPYVGVVIWMSCFYLVNVGNEITAYSYMETFAVLELRWTKSEGAYISSVYWISFAVSLLACVFTASYANPVKLLFICFLFLVPSHVLFVFMSLHRVDVGVWISTILYSAALGPTYSYFLVWLNSNLITLTGKVNSCIGLASTVGSLVSISIVGYVIENYGAIWIAYVLLGEAALNCLFFVSLFLFTRLYLQPKYKATTDFVVTYSPTNDGSASASALLK